MDSWCRETCEIPRRDLRLLVDAQRQGAIGRIQVEAAGIPHLPHEGRVLRELEGLRPMRLLTEAAPDSTDRALAQPAERRYGPGAPVGRLARFRLQRQRHQLLDLRIADPEGPGTERMRRR